MVAIQGSDGCNMWNSSPGRRDFDIWHLCLLWDKPAFKCQKLQWRVMPYNITGQPCSSQDVISNTTKHNKTQKDRRKKRKSTTPTSPPAGKGEGSGVSQHFGQHSPALPLPISNINTSEVSKAMEHDGWYGDMMEGCGGDSQATEAELDYLGVNEKKE